MILALAGCAVAVVMKCPLAWSRWPDSPPVRYPVLDRLAAQQRLKAFSTHPDALEMLARALRAGQSLAFGFNAVATEMGPPIGKEFGRVFEEQNLGVARTTACGRCASACPISTCGSSSRR